MKKIFLLTIITITSLAVKAQQDFKTAAASARTAYAAGKLEDAHFSLQQALQELDIIIGKEVIKLLPAKMDSLNTNAAEDGVTSTSGYLGTTIRRVYTTPSKNAELQIVSNSPLIGTLNAFLNTPLLAGLGSDGKTKVIKIAGYKGRLTKEDGYSEDATTPAQPSYKIEVPFSNALVTFTVTKSNEAEIVRLANTIPLAQIAKLIQ
ncbi:MAG: hypothetical protein J0I41_15155 [Filimonas sp.]|nr:hypothetical protein [Filimonas sp.]